MPEQADRRTIPTVLSDHWRHLVITLIAVASLLIVFSQPPIAQDQNYHNFADQRPFLGIPNFGDVASNLGFLIVGILGLKVSTRRRLGTMKKAWIVMFAGITLVGVASAYYHWNRTDQTLVWDRITLAVGFMGMVIAILGEYISERFRLLLVPAVVLGVFSVLYWSWYDDLRLYYWVQMVPLLLIPFIMVLYRAKYSHQWLVLAGALWYGLAKLAELGDRTIFFATFGTISGHTIKHLLAAVGCLSIMLALRRREPKHRATA